MIDWRTFYTMMNGAGYTGPYLFELGEAVSGRKMPVSELGERFKTVIGYAD